MDYAIFFLVFVHFFDKGKEPGLEQTVIFVGDNEVADTVEAAITKSFTVKVEITDITRSHTLHNVFFNSTTGCHNAIDHLVLAKIPNVLAHSTANHIAGVA